MIPAQRPGRGFELKEVHWRFTGTAWTAGKKKDAEDASLAKHDLL